MLANIYRLPKSRAMRLQMMLEATQQAKDVSEMLENATKRGLQLDLAYVASLNDAVAKINFLAQYEMCDIV